jgi:hypothetical protein
MSVHTIRLFTTPENLGPEAGDNDVREYQEFIEPRLRFCYAGANIEIRTGLGTNSVIADTTEEELAVDLHLESLWDQFCDR